MNESARRFPTRQAMEIQMNADTEGSAVVYRLKLEGPGFSINKEVEAGVAAAIAQITLGGFPAGRGGQHTLGASSASALSSGQPMSLREFLQRVATSANIPTKILAVGRYLRDQENRPDFDRDEIRDQFRAAGEPQPANFPRDFRAAVQEGWIAEDPKNRGRFYVTRTGDETLDRGSGSTSSTPPRRQRRRRRSIDDADGS
jgi:hypothetical protein